MSRGAEFLAIDTGQHLSIPDRPSILRDLAPVAPRLKLRL